MRGRRVAVAAAVLLGAVACTAQGRPAAHAAPPAARQSTPSAAAPSCRPTAVHWGAVKQSWPLTRVSPIIRNHVGGGWIRYRTDLVHTVVAHVDTGTEGLSGQSVIASLARHLDYEPDQLALPGVSTADHPGHPDQVLSDSDDSFFATEFVEKLDAPFTATCSHATVHGSATTWLLLFTGSDFLHCGTDPGSAPSSKEAYRLRCGGATSSEPVAEG